MKKLSIILSLALLPVLLLAQIPNKINYQGYLTDASGAVNGSPNITFRIYDVNSGGTALWAENHPSVNVSEGRFHVLLGNYTALDLPFDKQYYLGIQVETNSEFLPRIELSSVAYSYNSKNADNAKAIADNTVGTKKIRDKAVTKDKLSSDVQATLGEGAVPIGAVIDWWRPDNTWEVPDGFAICDGSRVNDADSPLNGKTLPNLKDRFIRGATDFKDIGTTGGSESHNHTVNIDHNHASVNSSTTGEHLHIWSYYTGSSKKWYTANSSGSWIDMMDWGDGMDADGNGQYPLQAASGSTTYYFYTRKAGNHYHSVNLPSLGATNRTSSTISNLPPYYGLLKIMRIR